MAAIAKRWNGEAVGRGRCGGMWAGINAEIEMTTVDRIEGAAENADAPAHR